jgi:predicted sulfurtransferase
LQWNKTITPSKLTVKVRDKIVADGLVDETFDVTNIRIHLKAKGIQRIEP